MKLRSAIRIVLISLGLGVVTTYVVSWGFMNSYTDRPLRMIQYRGRPRYDASESAGWIAEFDRRLGRASMLATANDYHLWKSGVNASSGADSSWTLARVVSPLELYPKRIEQFFYGDFLERGTGWPCLAVVERRISKQPGTYPNRQYGTALQIGGADDECWSGIVFAFTPIWKGFLVNTMLYGAVWAGLIWGVPGVRRWRRRAAGLCAWCLYDLSGLTGEVCPECGAVVGRVRNPPPPERRERSESALKAGGGTFLRNRARGLGLRT